MLRKVVFWTHLSCGVAAGLVILMMSVTGVILTYERQVLAFADRGYRAQPTPGQQRLSIDALLAATEEQIEFSPTSITLASDPAAPAMLRAGRSSSAYVNPYTGDIYPAQNQALDDFFSTVTRLHRWFNVSGEGRDAARAVTGISNLLFLFLIVSGLYLWLPRLYRWSAFRLRLWFSKTPSGAARDYNWHHVLGIWAAIPLLVIVATATVFNYSWANNLVYQLVGDEPPQRGARVREEVATVGGDSINRLPLETLFQRATEELQQWNTLTLNLPRPAGSNAISFSVDQGNGGQPQKRHSLTLNANTGELMSWDPFSSLSAGRQARSWVRFLHTGEALGVFGQTLAGLASLAATVMVWTGLALAFRRLRRFIDRRKISDTALEGR